VGVRRLELDEQPLVTELSYELVARWPGDAPREDSLWRTLARGVQQGLFSVTGGGTKTDPFRYGIAGPKQEGEQAAG
jgi:hypothetical protein